MEECSQSSGSSQSSQSSQSQILTDGVGAKDPDISQWKCFQKNKAEIFILELQRGAVLGQMMSAFCQDRLPDKIIYSGEKCNLTEAYEEFWTQLYDSPAFSKGHLIKLPNEENLKDSEMTAIAKILRRGWEDEHYLPKRIAQPLLEACLFNREDLEDVKIPADILLSYIQPSDEEIINRDIEVVDTQMLQVFTSYCPNFTTTVHNLIREGDDKDEACRKAAFIIMLVSNKRTIDCWTAELAGLLELEEFNFLMKPVKFDDWFIDGDLSLSQTPHKLWHTFFYHWPQKKINFYSMAIKNKRLGKRCNLCLEEDVVAKHLLSACNLWQIQARTVHKETHDCVLKLILGVFKTALEGRAGPYFSRGTDWKYLTMFGNYKYDFPEELSMLRKQFKYPHILAFCSSPVKRALIIEPAVSWEFWMEDARGNKERSYKSFCDTLRVHGYKVDLEVIMVGRRGVLSPDLYNLFECYFGMTHQKISRVMEKISRKIITVSFNEYMNSRTSRV